MQQIHLWKITPERRLTGIPASNSGLEDWLESRLASDISVVDPDLMVIGKQVTTGYHGRLDLLCMDRNGDLVVVEIESGRSPREVTAQALDYASWVKDLTYERVVNIADRYWVDPAPWRRLSGRGLRPTSLSN